MTEDAPDLAARLAALERPDGLERLLRARRAGRGVLVAFSHLGAFPILPRAPARHVTPLHVVVRDDGGALQATPGHARWLVPHRRRFERLGGRMVPRGDTWRVLRALLERGEVVAAAWDVHGDTPVPLLGREARVAGGAAVLPASVWREGHRLRGRVSPAVHVGPGEEGRVFAHLAAGAEEAARPRLAQLYPGVGRLLGAAP